MAMKHFENEYNILIKKMKKIESYLKNAPEGYLKISTRKNGCSYYHMIKDKKENCKYLEKQNENDVFLIKKLVQKQYYQKLLPVIKEEKAALEKFLEGYKPQLKYEVYDSLSQPRKQFIISEFVTPEQITEQWELEEYQSNSKYPEHLIYETNRGDMVRSKSEIIIADLLYYIESSAEPLEPKVVRNLMREYLM